MFDLQQALLQLRPPSNTRTFTADAASVRTNIPTSIGMLAVGHLPHDCEPQHGLDCPAKAVEKALALAMRDNMFSFGGMEFEQLSGTAVGTPPAPPCAALCCAVHE